MEPKGRFQSKCKSHYGSVISDFEMSVETSLKSTVRSENQFCCCLMKKDEADSACVSRKGEREKEVISRIELKGFAEIVEGKGQSKVTQICVAGKMTEMGNLGAGLCWCVCVCVRVGWVYWFPRVDTTPQTEWLHQQKLVSQSSVG